MSEEVAAAESTAKKVDIKKLLKSVLAFKSSDLHLVVGSEPQIRIDKELRPLNLPVLSANDVEEMAYSLIEDKQKKEFEEHNELDFSFELKNIGRFRANYYRTIHGIGCAFRMIPIDILITIEDPVEFVHKNIKSLFSQRDVGSNTESFAAALKYSLRQDPDIILIGEMRDAETIGAALTAAETGHLVFGTLHTNSAPGTINRIIDVFAGEEQAQIRAQLASSLVAVISQTLIPRFSLPIQRFKIRYVKIKYTKPF